MAKDKVEAKIVVGKHDLKHPTNSDVKGKDKFTKENKSKDSYA